MEKPKPELITEEEMGKLILSALSVRPHDEKDLISVVRWAEDIRLGEMALNSVLSGKINAAWDGGEVRLSLANYNYIQHT